MFRRLIATRVLGRGEGRSIEAQQALGGVFVWKANVGSAGWGVQPHSLFASSITLVLRCWFWKVVQVSVGVWLGRGSAERGGGGVGVGVAYGVSGQRAIC